MKYFIKTIALTLLILFSSSLYSMNNPYFFKHQSETLRLVLTKEKRTVYFKEIIELINWIDHTYDDVYKKIISGKKIVIFFDPAHGKLKDGRWQAGSATNRLSCTKKPEEYYSIPFSRKMYELLSQNKNITVRSTDDYMYLLKGQQNTYANIPFSQTVKMAKRENAFIIISEHLNNVSVIHKADGRVNIPGIHITYDSRGNQILKHVNGSYSGFLTLYNKLDASGFSRSYAHTLKKKLVKKGLRPNSWEFGAVGDSRFSYFVDFPISVIFESGFISNPAEEKKLRNPEYINKIVESQYDALIDNINTIFGVDISDFPPEQNHKNTKNRLELLKLSRISVMYLKKGETARAISTIKIMEKKYRGTKYKKNILYYTNIRKRLLRGEKYYRIGKLNRARRKYRKAKRYFKKARNSVNNDTVFISYMKKYSRFLKKSSNNKKNRAYNHSNDNDSIEFTQNVKRSPRSRRIIFAVEKGQSLENAISLALSPDSRTLKKLTKSFKNTKIVHWIKRRKYSKKRRRRVTYWKKRVQKYRYTNGIYIVNLNKKLKISKVRRVSSVRLNPSKYQNQQYLKNSYFAIGKRNKAL